jgi:hypothetical protein
MGHWALSWGAVLLGWSVISAASQCIARFLAARPQGGFGEAASVVSSESSSIRDNYLLLVVENFASAIDKGRATVAFRQQRSVVASLVF